MPQASTGKSIRTINSELVTTPEEDIRDGHVPHKTNKTLPPILSMALLDQEHILVGERPRHQDAKRLTWSRWSRWIAAPLFENEWKSAMDDPCSLFRKWSRTSTRCRSQSEGFAWIRNIQAQFRQCHLRRCRSRCHLRGRRCRSHRYRLCQATLGHRSNRGALWSHPLSSVCQVRVRKRLGLSSIGRSESQVEIKMIDTFRRSASGTSIPRRSSADTNFTQSLYCTSLYEICYF